jgi:hypothetical protein
MALEQPRPRSLSKNGPRSRFTTVRVEVCDHTGRKRLEVVRPRGWTMKALQVVDASGELLGTVRRQGRRTFVLHDAWGLPVGLIERRSGAGVDHALKDPSGREIGTISDYWHLAERTKPPRTDRWTRLKKALDGHVAREHVLEFTDPHLTRESFSCSPTRGGRERLPRVSGPLPRRRRLTAFYSLSRAPGFRPSSRATTARRSFSPDGAARKRRPEHWLLRRPGERERQPLWRRGSISSGPTRRPTRSRCIKASYARKKSQASRIRCVWPGVNSV